MAWDTQTPILLRALINDWDDPPKYADSRLLTLALISAQLIQTELYFTNTYEIDIEQLTLTPDPTLADTRDNSFYNLLLLRAACIFGTGKVTEAGDDSILIRDTDGSTIDLRKSLQGIQLIAKNACDTYAQAKLQYQVSGSGIVGGAGEAILGPYKLCVNRYLDNRAYRPYCGGYYF